MTRPFEPFGDWNQLLATARAGDATALEKLLALTRHYLQLVAGSHVASTTQSKFSDSDIIQESLVEVATGLRQFLGQSEAEFQQWAERILRHNFVDAQRMFVSAERRDVRREVPNINLSAQRGAEKTPSSIARRTERDTSLATAIAKLPENYQAVLHLRHQQGMRWEEVSAHMNISAEAARKLWARAVKRLQQQLIMGGSGIV